MEAGKKPRAASALTEGGGKPRAASALTEAFRGRGRGFYSFLFFCYERS